MGSALVADGAGKCDHSRPLRCPAECRFSNLWLWFSAVTRVWSCSGAAYCDYLLCFRCPLLELPSADIPVGGNSCRSWALEVNSASLGLAVLLDRPVQGKPLLRAGPEARCGRRPKNFLTLLSSSTHVFRSTEALASWAVGTAVTRPELEPLTTLYPAPFS